MTFEISLIRHINADKKFVFDWWTDLTSEDPKLVKPLKSRKIISKTQNMILLQDEEEMYFKRMEYEVRVTLEPPDSWISEYEGKDARARSEYLLEREDDGTTTLIYHTKIEPKGLFTRIFSSLVRPFVQHVFSCEMKTFIRVLEQEYRSKRVG